MHRQILFSLAIAAIAEAILMLTSAEQVPSFHSFQKRFLWTHKEVDLSLYPVIGLVLQVGDVENFPQTLGFENLDPFFFSQQAGSLFRSRGGR